MQTGEVGAEVALDLTHKKKELERELQSITGKLAQMGRHPMPGVAITFWVEALQKIIVDKGLATRDELDIAYLTALKDTLSCELLELSSPKSKLLIPQVRV